MKKTFQTNNSIGHIETNEDDEKTPSGGPLAPAGVKFAGDEDYLPQYRKILPDFDPDAGSGGPLIPGIKDEENNQ